MAEQTVTIKLNLDTTGYSAGLKQIKKEMGDLGLSGGTAKGGGGAKAGGAKKESGGWFEQILLENRKTTAAVVSMFRGNLSSFNVLAAIEGILALSLAALIPLVAGIALLTVLMAAFMVAFKPILTVLTAIGKVLGVALLPISMVIVRFLLPLIYALMPVVNLMHKWFSSSPVSPLEQAKQQATPEGQKQLAASYEKDPIGTAIGETVLRLRISLDWLLSIPNWLINEIIKPGLKGMYDIGKWLWDTITPILGTGWDLLNGLAKWVWDEATKWLGVGWDLLNGLAKWVWDEATKWLGKGWTLAVNIGTWIWDEATKWLGKGWDKLNEIGTWIYDEVILKVAEGLAKLLTPLYDLGKAIYNVFVGIINAMMSAVYGFIKSSPIGKYVSGFLGDAPQITPVQDFVMTPTGGLIKTSPQDYLFGTKNPSSMGGSSQVFNININVTGGSNTQELVREISRQLQSELRSRSGYGSG